MNLSPRFDFRNNSKSSNRSENRPLIMYGDDQFTINNVYNFFKDAEKAYPSQYPQFYIYHTKTQTRIGYTPKRARTSVKKIHKVIDLIR